MSMAHKEGNRTKGQREYDYDWIGQLYIRGLTPGQIAKKLTEELGRKITAEMVRHDLNKIRDQWLNSAMVSYDEAKAKEVAHIDEVERAAWEGWARSIQDQITETKESVDDTFGKPTPENYGAVKTEDFQDQGGGKNEDEQEAIGKAVVDRARIISYDDNAHVGLEIEGEDEDEGEDGSADEKGKGGSTYSRRKGVVKAVSQVGSARFLQVIQWCIEQRCRIYGLHQPEKFQIDWKQKAVQAGFSETEANNQFSNMVKLWADVLAEKESRGEELPDFNDPDDPAMGEYDYDDE
jgi:hypothetical protein